MKKTSFWMLVLLFGASMAGAQQADITAGIVSGERASIAVPSFRGAGGSGPVMEAFNETLFLDLQESGLFRMVPKSMYPLTVPQQPNDFVEPSAGDGPWLTDWSEPPASADYLTIGYGAETAGQLVVYGYLFNVNQANVANAQIFGKFYNAALDQGGARQVAHEFAADILGQFGYKGMYGTKIYFTSNRTGAKEIWEMDYDGSNQRQITKYGNISSFPAVSPDRSKLVFTTWASGQPMIRVFSLVTGNQLPFLNMEASVNGTAKFTPDGERLVFSSSAASKDPQVFIANIDGSGVERVSYSRGIDMEPSVNPQTGRDIVFTSGRGGTPQIYRMNLDGTGTTRLTTGEGEAVNPAWHPNGQHIAFSWTRGYDPGNFNIFIMDVASRQVDQLTHGAGKNENPNWAPDGRHLVFSSDRSGSLQIWTMLADGTQLHQLTSEGENEKPVWSTQ
jgi:TolB protein